MVRPEIDQNGLFPIIFVSLILRQNLDNWQDSKAFDTYNKNEIINNFSNLGTKIEFVVYF